MAELNNPYAAEKSTWFKEEGEYGRWFKNNEGFMDQWLDETIDTLDELPQVVRNLMGKISGGGIRRQVQAAINKMKNAAEERGIKIHLQSAHRDFSYQNKIWTKKFNRFTNGGDKTDVAIHRIIEYSTIPGTSRHHWGTEIDIIDANQELREGDKLQAKFFVEGQAYGALKNWMDEHANSFGFYLVYTNAPGRKGFKYEPWHYSYAPLSKIYYKQYNEKFEEIKKVIQASKLKGHQHITDAFLDAYQKTHLMDINPELT
ncbi:MAG: M15 family metallopeptidase [Flavobacteriales bacterium]|nr:M15 family metallopeptidase [Flavobacteriales bacterium]